MNNTMEAVCTVCNVVKNNTEPCTSFQMLLTRLRRAFRLHDIALKIKSERDKTLNSDVFYINAYYDPEDDKELEVAIEVVVHHNFPKDRIWEKVAITEFLIQIFDAVVHEFKHRRQSRKRYYNVYWHHNNYRDYLKDPDEVDAYALSIAIELCRALGKHRALRYMSKLTALARFKIKDHLVSPNLSSYLNEFGGIDNQLIRKLAKKVYVRLQKIDTDAIFV
jgi:hypothetical protein